MSDTEAMAAESTAPHESTVNAAGETATGADWPGAEAPGAGKRDVIAGLGERALLLPSLVTAGLEANDRAKYLLTLLQAAREHADDPMASYSVLRLERLAAGVGDAQLDEVVGRSQAIAGGYFVPGAAELVDALIEAVRDMLHPLTDRDIVDPKRLIRLVEEQPPPAGDTIPGAFFDRMAITDPAQGDSLHLLIMDAHRELNRLQAELATEAVDGASTYNLASGDRELVAAFMAGVHRTAALRLDHPGLGTTATHSGSRLLLQNDIGETAAHVVVVAVEQNTVTVTYTDVHRRRLAFFRGLLEPFDMHWSGDQDRHGGATLGNYHLTVGEYRASDTAGACEFLRHLGSRLVFLIDWNRARKRLTRIVGATEALAVLRWAADEDLGHVPFLRLGGERLVYDAVETASRVPPRYGGTLSDVLGQDAVAELVRYAVRSASVGLRCGKSPQLIRDEIRVETMRHLRAAQSMLLATAAEHAGLVVEAAQLLWIGLVTVGGPEGAEFVARAARRAQAWEHQADEILRDVRRRAASVEGGSAVAGLVAASDDAIDDIEEAIFLLTLLPPAATVLARPMLSAVATTAVSGAKECLKAVIIAGDVFNGATPDDLEDFLIAVDTVARIEHEADQADRECRAALVEQAPDFRTLYVADSISRATENATDALLHAAQRLRDHVLERSERK